MSRNEKIVALFPGQGGIKPGIGEEPFNKSTDGKKTFFLASSEVGVDLAEVVYGSKTDEIGQYAQIARTAASLVEFDYAVEQGLKISGAGGHSLGQVAAMGALGIIERPHVFALVNKRQEAMDYSNSVTQGLMVALIGSTEAMAERIAQLAKAKLTNQNASDQQVLSGHERLDELHIKERVELAVTVVKEEIMATARGEKKLPKIRVHLLGRETGAAHHDELQLPGQPIFQEGVDRLKDRFKHAQPGAFLSNSVQWLTRPDQFAQELVNGLTQGVNFRGQMKEYYDSNFYLFFETPSTEVLKGLIIRDYETELLSRKFGQLVKIIGPKPTLPDEQFDEAA